MRLFVLNKSTHQHLNLFFYIEHMNQDYKKVPAPKWVQKLLLAIIILGIIGGLINYFFLGNMDL